MSRAGFINNVLLKIEEVWLGKGATPQPSPVKRLAETSLFYTHTHPFLIYIYIITSNLFGFPVFSPQAVEIQIPKPSLALSDPFLGTPITMTSKKKSR